MVAHPFLLGLPASPPLVQKGRGVAESHLSGGGLAHLFGESQFPSPQRPDSCPPPAGMLGEETLDWHDEEEECLFFVALSRARDRLRVYRARAYGGKERRESPLLRLVQGVIPDALPRPLARTEPKGKREESPLPVISREPFYEQQLRDYLICPLKYYYRHVLKISDRRSDSPYAQSHLCVHRVWQFIENELEAGRSVDEAVLSA